MQDKTMKEVTIEHIKSVTGESCYIDNDLILFDHFEDLPLPLEPHKMSCLLIGMCIQGRAEYLVDTKKCTIQANDMIVLSEGQVISDYMLSRDCRGIAILASENFLQDILRGIHEMSSLFIFTKTHPVLHLTSNEAKAFEEFFQITKQKVDDKSHHFRRESACAMLSSLVYDMGNHIWRTQQIGGDGRLSRGEKIFTDFIKLVEQNYREIRRVSWYAEKLCITPKYLSETVKKVSKETPNSWIDSYVTKELRLLLKNSSKNIKEIAVEMNFPNQSFLGKYFKDRTGQSPSDYRKS